jgi:hypothetical protein
LCFKTRTKVQLTPVLAAARFEGLLSAVKVSPADRSAAIAAADGVRRLLARHYRAPLLVEKPRLVGAWDKDTEVAPPRDIDVLVTLPASLEKADGARGNLQLELLHDMKEALHPISSEARLRKDGLTVVVPIGTVGVQVLAGFSRGGGRYDQCDAAEGGRFRRIAPDAERQRLDDSDRRTKGCTRALVRFLKTWQAHRGVPISSPAIEWLAVETLERWDHERDGSRYFDWMVRDAFGYMAGRRPGDADVPATGERFNIGVSWMPSARAAHEHAVKACDFETAARDRDAWWEWEKIFGDAVPFD